MMKRRLIAVRAVLLAGALGSACFPCLAQQREGSSVGEEESILLAPANDTCSGAEAIPPSGPFPHLSSTVAISSATSAGDPVPTCQTNVSGGIWFAFTPSVTSSYTFSTCKNLATGTTRSDTVLAVYASTGGACPQGAQAACNDDDTTCSGTTLQSTLSMSMTAGTTYFIVAYGWGSPPSGAIQLWVNRAPSNDACGAATPLALDTPLTGTTTGAVNDYRLTGSSCFAGVGQTASNAQGRDVSYSFTAPSTGTYSFRLGKYSAGNGMIYVASTCPTGARPINVTTCTAAANRSAGPAEEVMCLPITGGATVYAFVDETAQSVGGTFAVEVNRCVRETEPNDDTGTAGSLTCGVEGSISPAADVDVFHLGTSTAGSRVFAVAEALAANGTGSNTSGADYRMRVTTSTDTLEFDDDGADTAFGARAPALAGTPLPAEDAYIRLDHTSTTAIAEPYRLYAAVQPPLATATPETEPNGTPGQANQAGNEYFLGILGGAAPSTDVDLFSFAANARDLIVLGLDGDPFRDSTPVDARLELLDASGVLLVSVNDNDSVSSTTPSPGTVSGTTPFSPSETLLYRTMTAGVYYARVVIGTSTTSPPGAGDYLLSISKNCTTGTGADLSIALTDAPDPVATGQSVTYSLTLGNTGPGAAVGVQVQAPIPAGTTFVSVAGAGWSCSAPPVGGTGTVSCSLASLAAGAISDATLVVKVDGCLGNGAVIAAAADVTSITNDPASANNTASATTLVTDSGTCDDGDACTTNDACAGTACVGGPPLSCDDSNVCTSDFCNPASGCGHTIAGGPCEDGNACTMNDFCNFGTCAGGNPVPCGDGNVCTDDGCNPATGCVYTNNTGPCSDFNPCTTPDVCAGGTCQPGGPRSCDDVNICTFDYCDHLEGCNNVPIAGSCNDGNACTTDDSCTDGECLGGPPLACDDGNPCTDDCSPAVGCTPTNNTATCNDGDLCTTNDVCSGGVCGGGPALDCNDDDTCTDDGCNPSLGCTHANNSSPCNDGNPCTSEDACADGACAGAPSPGPCDDGNPCTTGDTCGGGTCLAGTPNSDPCNDGNACTQSDQCQAGLCSGGPPVNCNDPNPCTDDSCHPVTGCAHAFNTAACNDENACTTGDACSGGACFGGPPADCNDGNLCTNDSCDVFKGCQHAWNTVSCEDGSVCTTGDTCGGGVCRPGTPVPGPCDDNSVCTNNDACSGGICVGGSPLDCFDDNPCTDDCDPVLGCIQENNTDTCDDGNACTLQDQCSGGACIGGPSRDCDDANACTDDACNLSTGCVNTNNTQPCDDGNGCTRADVCSGGACSGMPTADLCDDGSACTQNDACSNGLCSGSPLECGDVDPCTADSCHVATGCVNQSGDADADTVCDLLDNCPTTANLDQEDGDGDTVGDACDCVPGDSTYFAVPSPATGFLLVNHGPTTLEWGPPDSPGGSFVAYDVLRSENRANFTLSEPTSECIATNITATTAMDVGGPPLVNVTFYYLVRAHNPCGGTLGQTSAGAARSGRACP